MRRTNRDHAICFESLEKALAESPETYGHIDILCAGWPCQDNSIAGSRKGHEGSRSGLWSEVRRLLTLFRPRWFVGENVPGLYSVRNGKDFWGVVSDLDAIGYCVAWRVLDSQYFGVPQRRKRIFVVGSLGNTDSAKALFDDESVAGNYPAKQKVGQRGLCISTRDGQRQDPTIETTVASTIGTSSNPVKLHQENIVGQKFTTVRPSNVGNRIQGYISTQIDADREGTVARFSGKLDSVRGILIGNAVSVPVAEWIGKRIREVESERKD